MTPTEDARLDDHTIVAFNTATASTNKIHDDDVARTYGFRGGLVPGVDVYAYLTHLPAREWGRSWLEHGSMTARFSTPVYDGRPVTVSGIRSGDDLELSVSDEGVACATGRASRSARLGELPVPRAAPLPVERPPASPATLQPGTVLGAVTDTFDVATHRGYLADARESLPLYAKDGIAHPGWLLRFANAALALNVELGPWIHVSSEVDLLGVVAGGQHVEARSVVLDEFERKGHRFVTLDVAVLANERLVQRITHTAIYAPRMVESPSA